MVLSRGPSERCRARLWDAWSENEQWSHHIELGREGLTAVAKKAFEECGAFVYPNAPKHLKAVV